MTHAETKAMTQPKPARVLPGDPDRAMEDMLGVIERLFGVIRAETESVRKADTKAFLGLQQHKLAAAQDYQACVGQMIARREEMKRADPALRAALEKMRIEFAEMVEINRQELDRMCRSMKRLGDRMMTLARRAAESKTNISYNAKGAMDNGERRLSMGVSESA